MDCAKMRPQARESSTVSIASGPRRARTEAITFSRACSYGTLFLRLEPGGELRPRSDDRGVAFRSCGNHPDFDLELIGNKFQVVESSLGQVFGVANAFSRCLPAPQRAVFRANIVEIFAGSRHFVNRRSLIAVADTHLNFALRIENVELGDNERSDSIDHNGIAQHGEVQPSAAARAARDRSILFAAVADFARA